MGISEVRSPHSSPERTGPQPERRIGVSAQSTGVPRSDSRLASLRRDSVEPRPVQGSPGPAELEQALDCGMRGDSRRR
jgi:hypothetical protein